MWTDEINRPNFKSAFAACAPPSSSAGRGG